MAECDCIRHVVVDLFGGPNRSVCSRGHRRRQQCTRPSRRRNACIVGQTEIDWGIRPKWWRPRKTRLEHYPRKPQPYPFDVIDQRIRGRYGDQELAKRLKCSWVRLAVYRRDGLNEYQADRIAMRLFDAVPYELWSNYGMEDDMDMDLEEWE